MNPTLLILLLIAPLAIAVKNPADVKLTGFSPENQDGMDKVATNSKTDTAFVACISGSADGQFYYNYRMLKDLGENLKVEGEWRYDETRPNGVQWTFVIDGDTYDTVLSLCMRDKNKYGQELWEYVQPVKQGHENEQWYLFEMKDDKNACGPGIVGTVAQMGHFNWYGDCDRSTEFLQGIQYH